MAKISGDSHSSPYYGNPAGAIKGGIRAHYDKSKKEFGLIEGIGTKSTSQLNNMIARAGEIKVPVDYTSTTFLQGVKTKTDFSGKQIESKSTKLKDFFSDNPASFFTSISEAQATLSPAP